MIPYASVCMSAFNKPHLLGPTLDSIYRQLPPFQFEVIVVDDGSADGRIREVCRHYPVKYHRIDREPVFRNPCVARNVAYRAAQGEVIIAQSDEVLHVTEDAMERLVGELKPGNFVLAHVLCLDRRGRVCGEFTGPGRRKPFFFLGALRREDLYAVGGNDEEFLVAPAWEDQWFGDCLTNGRHLTPVYTTQVIGYHQWHEYVSRPETEGPSRDLYHRKRDAAAGSKIPWCSSGGPWSYYPTEDRRGSTNNLRAVFSAIHGSDGFYEGEDPEHESRSGAGSSLLATARVREGLEKVIRKLNVGMVLDAPCGDYNWIQHADLGWTQYVGVDIVPGLVAENVRRYGLDFRCLDLAADPLPPADLVICRDCLGHLDHGSALRVLQNICYGRDGYLLATTFPGRQNKSIRAGHWYPINLQAPPFNLPEPLELINEDCQELYPQFQDKSLGLWRITDLLQPLGLTTRSLVVCVEYDDFLAITLPRNRGLFAGTLVVTSPADSRTQALAQACGCDVHTTGAFYGGGAHFNKGAAVEEGFDVLGRDGWIVVWDADVVMPRDITVRFRDERCLYVPVRRILADPRGFCDDLDWSGLPSPTQPHEFDGYFQMFHAGAIRPPWYGTQWKHAGGCDSDFQFKFPEGRRLRPPFEVLHLGEEGPVDRVGPNWCGRTTPRIDTGAIHPDAAVRRAILQKMIADRTRLGNTVKERL